MTTKSSGYRPEHTAPHEVPPTGPVATGDTHGTGDHDLHTINLNALDVALDLARITVDHSDCDPETTTSDLAELIDALRTLTGEATETVLIAAVRQLVTDYLPAILDPAAAAGFVAELSEANAERTPGAQIPRIRPTRCLPPTETLAR